MGLCGYFCDGLMKLKPENLYLNSELVILPIEKKMLVELEHKNIISSNLAPQKARKMNF